MRFLALVLALVPCVSLADDVMFTPAPVSLSLDRGTLFVARGEVDVLITEDTVFATHGARYGEKAPFVKQLRLESGGVLEVQDMLGLVHRVCVTAQPGGNVRLALLTGSAPAPASLRPGAFDTLFVRVDSEATDGDFGRLKLQPDGHYKLGQATGRWRIKDGRLVLDGPFSHWGAGTVSADGRVLSFSFLRGPLWWQVDYSRVGEPLSASK